MFQTLYYTTTLFILIVVPLCAIYGYVRCRKKGAADTKYRMAMASLLSVPLLLYLVLISNQIVCTWLAANLPWRDVARLFQLASLRLFIPSLQGHLLLLSPVGKAYLFITAVFIGLAWFAQANSFRYKMTLAAYTSVLAFYVGYFVWAAER